MLTTAVVFKGVEMKLDVKKFLFGIRSNWNDALFKNINKSVNNVFKDVLGITANKDQVAASKALYVALEAVIPKLRTFRNTVIIDF